MMLAAESQTCPCPAAAAAACTGVPPPPSTMGRPFLTPSTPPAAALTLSARRFCWTCWILGVLARHQRSQTAKQAGVAQVAWLVSHEVQLVGQGGAAGPVGHLGSALGHTSGALDTSATSCILCRVPKAFETKAVGFQCRGWAG